MKYLIEGSYGEYDDYNRLPVMVVPDKETAQMVVDELYKPNNQFMGLINEIFEHVRFETICFSWSEIKYFSLE